MNENLKFFKKVKYINFFTCQHLNSNAITNLGNHVSSCADSGGCYRRRATPVGLLRHSHRRLWRSFWRLGAGRTSVYWKKSPGSCVTFLHILQTINIRKTRPLVKTGALNLSNLQEMPHITYLGSLTKGKKTLSDVNYRIKRFTNCLLQRIL